MPRTASIGPYDFDELVQLDAGGATRRGTS